MRWLLVALGSAVVLFWPRLCKDKLSTKSPEARELYAKARDYEQKGDDEQALTALGHAIAADTRFAEAYLRAASIYQDIGEDLRARQMARKAEEFSIAFPEPFKLRLKGLLYELDGNSEKALETYQLLVDLCPRDAEGYLDLAVAATEEGRLDEARRSLESCLRIESTNPFCHYFLMFSQLRNNEFDAVLNSYESLRKRNVEYPWFDEPVGIALWAKDDLDKAAGHLQALSNARAGIMRLHGSAHSETAKEWIADIALYRGKVKEAKRRLEQLRADARNSDVEAGNLIYLARIELLLGDPAKARSLAVEATTTSTDARMLDAAGKVFGMAGASIEAVKALRQGRSGRGREDDARDASVEHFVRGAIALANGQVDKAIEELPLASERREDLEAQYLLAHAYMAAGQWESAIKLLDRLIQSKGRILLDYVPSIWVLAHYDLATCYERLGKKDQALANYSKFLKLWDSADPSIKQVTEATRQVTSLSKEN